MSTRIKIIRGTQRNHNHFICVLYRFVFVFISIMIFYVLSISSLYFLFYPGIPIGTIDLNTDDELQTDKIKVKYYSDLSQLYLVNVLQIDEEEKGLEE